MRRTPPLIPLAILVACLLAVFAWMRGRSAGEGLAGENRADASPSEPGALPALEGSDPSGLPSPEGAAPAPRTAAEGSGIAQDALPEPVPDARIDGLVLRPDGKPAPLARVQFTQWRSDRGPEDQPEDSTLTDEQGHFTINPAPVGSLRLIALHDEFAASARSDFVLAPGEQKRGLRLELREYGRIKGLVLDEHNVARAGLSITCADLDTRKALFAESDSAGRFDFTKVVAGYQLVSLKLPKQELDLIRSESTFLANVLADGDQEHFVEVAPGQTVELVLGGIPVDGVRVFGRVSSGGAALARTWIWSEIDTLPWGSGPRARTDERGEYELWLPGPCTCKFHICGGAGGLDLTHSAEITAKHEQRLDLELPGGTLSGRVVDSAGRPVTEVNVSLMESAIDGQAAPRPFELWNPHCRPDTDGRFRFTQLPAGRYEIAATPLSKPDAEAPFARVRIPGLVLVAGAVHPEVEIVLRPGCNIRGVVRGVPEGFARAVFVLAHDAPGGPSVASARVDADGSFVLRGLSEGLYVVRANGAGYVSPFSAPVQARAEREGQVELALEPGARLLLRAKWPREEPPVTLELCVRERRYVVYECSLDPSPDEQDFQVHAILSPGAHELEFSGPGGWHGIETVVLEGGKQTQFEWLPKRAK